MQLTCPNCNYSKQIDPARLPAGTTRATCPKCKQSFALPVTDRPPAPQPPAPGEETRADVHPEPPETQRQQEVDRLPKAGFWIRAVAALLDTGIVFVVQFVLGVLLALTGAAVGSGREANALVPLLGYALGFAYYIVFTGHCGQTPGKMAVRVKVIRTDGSSISYGRAAFREVIGKFISGIILGIGYLMIAFDDQKQGLHDRMADTYVIKL